MTALHHLTIAEAGRALRARTLSPVELTEAFLARIEAVDGRLHSYVLPTPERARADAKRAERELADGVDRGPLHGIPVAIKDIYATAGIRTTCHSRVLIDNVPTRDADSVRRLFEGGAVCLGKLSTHEFAFGGPSFDLPFPPARNPWNTAHFTAGSSSGSGAAVAAGLCMGAMGSDTAGSIRGPAALCGIAGLKPTYGRVSRAGVVPLAFTLDHAGPMAWTAEDCALMMQVLAGHDPRDAASSPAPVPDYRAALTGTDLAGLRIGVIRHFHEEDEVAHPEVIAAMHAAEATLAGLGAAVEDVRLSPLQDYSACGVVIMLAEAYAIHQKDLRERPDAYGEIARDRFMLASFLSAADYVQALRRRTQLMTELARVLERVDVLLTVGSFDPAPLIDAVPKFGLLARALITAPFNITGSPAISVCNGFSTDGLPLGMQIVGRPLDESTVLRVAHAYETATPWRGRRPTI